MRTLLPLAFLLAVACRTDPDKVDTDDASGDTGPEIVDVDQDGYGQDEDCDDEDSSIHPGAEEVCDGLDNDCDGAIDEDLGETWYADADGDGYGDPTSALDACEAPSGHVSDATDCDDADPETHPDAPERCDGIDNDCDGTVDEDLTEVWYLDADGDGFGDPGVSIDSCDPGEGWVALDLATDCDDGDPAVNPAAIEECNGVDDDCDGAVDEELEALWYADADGDGFGDPASEVYGCEPAAGYTADAGDCDDANSDIHPDAQEICDTLDNDCDGSVDDASAADAATWYADGDGDGYGDAGASTSACEQPSGHVSDASDCDDADAAVSPAGTELCDGIDNDCDGSVDEDDAGDASTWFADGDGDGYGDSGASTIACNQPSGHVVDATDCDDGAAAVNPAGTEACNGVDDDCDGSVDEDSAVDAGTWYADVDGDAYGDAASATSACSQPSGYVADATDCDDADAAVNPVATELCNGVDDDCDGSIDDDDPSLDAASTTTWYADGDGDGYGDVTSAADSCSQPSGYVGDATDCDDADAAVNPAADELCNGVDDDCDGGVDEDSAVDSNTWYADSDGDGYGDAGASIGACSQPSGYVGDATDCDDGDAAVSPSATETCDGVDQDCSGSLSWLEVDADGDGLLACELSLWLRSDGVTNNDPATSGTYGSSEAAALLVGVGLDFDTADLSTTSVTASLLDDYGLLVMNGTGDYGPLSAGEAAVLEDWVRDGGSLLYVAYHPYESTCDMVDSLPTAFGIGCAGYSSYWGGSATSVTAHALTTGVSSIQGSGGEHWTVTSPTLTLVDTTGWPVVAALELDDGRLVGVADEWWLYNSGSGSADISQGDNQVLVENVWAWLSEFAL